MSNTQSKVANLAKAGVVAGLYVAITLLLAPFSFGAVQPAPVGIVQQLVCVQQALHLGRDARMRNRQPDFAARSGRRHLRFARNARDDESQLLLDPKRRIRSEEACNLRNHLCPHVMERCFGTLFRKQGTVLDDLSDGRNRRTHFHGNRGHHRLRNQQSR